MDKWFVQTSGLSRPIHPQNSYQFKFKSGSYGIKQVWTNRLSRPLSRPNPSLGKIRSGQKTPFRGGLSCPDLTGGACPQVRGYGS